MQSSCSLKAQNHSGKLLAVLEFHCVIITSLCTHKQRHAATARVHGAAPPTAGL